MATPRILIVYGTGNGQTARITERLVNCLEDRGAQIQAYWTGALRVEATLRDFDGVMVGSSVHYLKHLDPVVDWVRAHQPFLANHPGAFYSVSASMASEEPEARREAEQLIDKFERRTGWQPQLRRPFAGALPYKQYGPILRTVMQAITAINGGETDVSKNWEYTDWKAVARFADDFFDYVADRTGEQPRPAGSRAAE